MPDLWEPNPRNAFSTPDEQPDLTPDGHHDDHTKEVMLKDNRGHLRPPAYLLIALVTALAAVLLLTVAMLIARRWCRPPTCRHLASCGPGSQPHSSSLGTRRRDRYPVEMAARTSSVRLDGRGRAARRAGGGWRRPRHPVLRCCYGAVGARATVHGVRRSPKPQVSMEM